MPKPKPILNVHIATTRDEKLAITVDTELQRDDIIALLEQVIDELEPEDTPEARAAGAWGARRRRRDE